MKPIHMIPALTLAVAIGLSGLAAAEPTQPAPGAAAQYNPKELSVDKIQSPRDPASGQEAGNSLSQNDVVDYAKTPPPATNVKVMFEDILVSSATSSNSGNAGSTQRTRTETVGANESIVSPRDPASGQATTGLHAEKGHRGGERRNPCQRFRIARSNRQGHHCGSDRRKESGFAATCNCERAVHR
jgi:hypothetical protein